jgi:two-component system chemotaxis response regulator CheB
MPVRVLVVDDSSFIRRRLTEIISNDKHLEVIGTAADGKEAIRQVEKLKPDVVTMDIEMPVMDGITAVRKIMQSHPLPILMFSSLSTEGAKATLDALDAGATDFLPKRMDDISEDRESAKRQLCARIRLIAARGLKKAILAPSAAAKAKTKTAKAAPVEHPEAKPHHGKYRLVVLGTSTGGPVALQQVLTGLPGSFPLPILLVQHMPANFTPAFAERLNKLCAINVKEAVDGDRLEKGWAYLAPGGQQMLLEEQRGHSIIRIVDSQPEQTYRPSVDITFGSAARLFGADVLAVVMTGMGADGREGARLLKRKGSSVWTQDRETSIIYGMPAAVAEAGLADKVLALDAIGPALMDAV